MSIIFDASIKKEEIEDERRKKKHQLENFFKKRFIHRTATLEINLILAFQCTLHFYTS